MNILDWVLVLVALAYALSGYWQGFIAGASATAGLLLGGLVGVWLAPSLLGGAHPSVWVSLGALFIVLVCASIGQATLQYAGARIRGKITWQPVRALDAVGGAALSMAAAMVVAWVLGVAVSGARLPSVSKLVRNSAVLGTVDRLMPDGADQALQSFNDVVGSSTFFPRYLEPFAPERIARVGPGPRRMTSDPEVLAARASVLKIRSENSCGEGVEGTGFLYSPGHIMTNAHVVAGVDSPTVLVGNSEVSAKVVYYDPDLDVAVLSVDGVRRPFLKFDKTGEARDPAAIEGYPQDGPFDLQPARIRGEQRLRSPNIYGNGTVIRQVFSIRGLVRPGNSGGPLISDDGDVLGVIFAASVSDSDTGYVLTAAQVSQGAAKGLTNDREVDTGHCA